MTPPKLIDRLEKADGPDRELDAAIGELFPKTVTDDYGAPLIDMDRGHLTASLDATLTLMEEVLPVPRWWPRLVLYEGIAGPMWQAQMDRPEDATEEEHHGVHQSSAIALLIAILKAKQAMEESA
ncbi:MAG: hypothetical protein AAFQ22_07235 [Pseudomonadota bacterium]